MKKKTVSNKTEIVNPIPQVKEKYKVYTFYNHVITHKEHPVSMGFIMDLRERWILDAKTNEKTFNAKRFILDEGIPWETCLDWQKRIPEFEQGYRTVLMLLALKREEKYIETNGSALAFMMPHYDDDYKAQHEWRSNLKAQEQVDKKESIKIVMHDYTRDKDG